MNRIVIIFPFLFFAIVSAKVRSWDDTAFSECMSSCKTTMAKVPTMFVQKSAKAELYDAEREFRCYKKCKKDASPAENKRIKPKIESLAKDLKSLYKQVMRSKKV
ncbi:unnamed protein product [Cylicocyclus nassatus]|uniref:Uncharacterized protein n=1 Tax=Cylicocyclus nassatus TaxID=53992 RepID=A0AA36DL86_CYLNA|nr:unnamed protein product [Cylicocyclus nassatus]